MTLRSSRSTPRPQVQRAGARESERERERAASPVSACDRVFVQALDAVDHLSPPLVALTLVRRRRMAVSCGHGLKIVSTGCSSTRQQRLDPSLCRSEGGRPLTLIRLAEMRRVVSERRRPRLGTALLVDAVARWTVMLVLRLPLRRFARHRAMLREVGCQFPVRIRRGRLCPRNESRSSIKRGNSMSLILRLYSLQKTCT